MTGTSISDEFDSYLSAYPAVAILRGVDPATVLQVGDALFQAGVRIIEVPLNSPDPYESIRRLVSNYGDKALIGAGTVLSTDQVDKVVAAGGRVIVSPNMDQAVIAATKAHGMVSLPGCLTPTEIFSALQAGADAIKLFPGEAVSPKIIKALLAVVPSHTRLLVVGGVTAETIPHFAAAGVSGFGIGSWLYKPNRSIEEIKERAEDLTQALSGRGFERS